MGMPLRTLATARHEPARRRLRVTFAMPEPVRRQESVARTLRNRLRASVHREYDRVSGGRSSNNGLRHGLRNETSTRDEGRVLLAHS